MNEIDIWQKLYPNMPFDKDYRKNKNYVSLGKPGRGWMNLKLYPRNVTKAEFEQNLASKRDSGRIYDIIFLIDPIKGSLKLMNKYMYMFRGQKIKIQLTADYKNSKFSPGTYTFYRKWRRSFPRQPIQKKAKR